MKIHRLMYTYPQKQFYKQKYKYIFHLYTQIYINTLKGKCYSLSSEKFFRRSWHVIEKCWKLSGWASIIFLEEVPVVPPLDPGFFVHSNNGLALGIFHSWYIYIYIYNIYKYIYIYHLLNIRSADYNLQWSIKVGMHPHVNVGKENATYV